MNAKTLSQTHLLISKISHVCQETHDIERSREPKSIEQANTITTMEVGNKTSPKRTQGPSTNSSAKEGSSDEGGSGDTYFSHSKQYHHEPSNHDTPSHHAPIPPSPNPAPSESTLEPPGCQKIGLVAFMFFLQSPSMFLLLTYSQLLFLLSDHYLRHSRQRRSVRPT